MEWRAAVLACAPTTRDWRLNLGKDSRAAELLNRVRSASKAITNKTCFEGAYWYNLEQATQGLKVDS